MKKLKNNFLHGLLYIAPIGITTYIIYGIFNFINNILAEVLEKFLGIDIPGLGFVVVFFLLVLTGIIGRSIIAEPIKTLFNRFLEKTPLLKLIYSALNDLFSAFVGEERKFNKPVMVLVNPISNLEKIGFLTVEDLSRIDEKDKVAVYFPHSYNFSGELFIVPKSQVRSLDIDPAMAMKFIVSGGVSGINEKQEPRNATI